MTGIGTIKALKTTFGFIEPDGPPQRGIFFHVGSMTYPEQFAELVLGDRVTFDSEMAEKGPRGFNVQKVATPTQPRDISAVVDV